MSEKTNSHTPTWRPMYYSRSNYITRSKITYRDYLASEVWEGIRSRRLAFDHYQCCLCHTGKQLEVHHITYPEIWGKEDIVNDLMTVCHDCHQLIHATDNLNKEAHINGTDFEFK